MDGRLPRPRATLPEREHSCNGKLGVRPYGRSPPSKVSLGTRDKRGQDTTGAEHGSTRGGKRDASHREAHVCELFGQSAQDPGLVLLAGRSHALERSVGHVLVRRSSPGEGPETRGESKFANPSVVTPSNAVLQRVPDCFAASATGCFRGRLQAGIGCNLWT